MFPILAIAVSVVFYAPYILQFVQNPAETFRDILVRSHDALIAGPFQVIKSISGRSSVSSAVENSTYKEPFETDKPKATDANSSRTRPLEIDDQSLLESPDTVLGTFSSSDGPPKAVKQDSPEKPSPSHLEVELCSTDSASNALVNYQLLDGLFGKICTFNFTEPYSFLTGIDHQLCRLTESITSKFPGEAGPSLSMTGSAVLAGSLFALFSVGLVWTRRVTKQAKPKSPVHERICIQPTPANSITVVNLSDNILGQIALTKDVSACPDGVADITTYLCMNATSDLAKSDSCHVFMEAQGASDNGPGLIETTDASMAVSVLTGTVMEAPVSPRVQQLPQCHGSPTKTGQCPASISEANTSIDTISLEDQQLSQCLILPSPSSQKMARDATPALGTTCGSDVAPDQNNPLQPLVTVEALQHPSSTARSPKTVPTGDTAIAWVADKDFDRIFQADYLASLGLESPRPAMASVTGSTGTSTVSSTDTSAADSTGTSVADLTDTFDADSTGTFATVFESTPKRVGSSLFGSGHLVVPCPSILDPPVQFKCGRPSSEGSSLIQALQFGVGSADDLVELARASGPNDEPSKAFDNATSDIGFYEVQSTTSQVQEETVACASSLTTSEPQVPVKEMQVEATVTTAEKQTTDLKSPNARSSHIQRLESPPSSPSLSSNRANTVDDEPESPPRADVKKLVADWDNRAKLESLKGQSMIPVRKRTELTTGVIMGLPDPRWLSYEESNHNNHPPSDEQVFGSHSRSHSVAAGPQLPPVQNTGFEPASYIIPARRISLDLEERDVEGSLIDRHPYGPDPEAGVSWLGRDEVQRQLPARLAKQESESGDRTRTAATPPTAVTPAGQDIVLGMEALAHPFA